MKKLTNGYTTEFESDGFTVKVVDNLFRIEIPIKNLIYGFNNGRDEPYGAKVIPGKEQEFAKNFAQFLLDDCDSESGNNYIADMFNRLCEEIYDCDRWINEDIVKLESLESNKED